VVTHLVVEQQIRYCPESISWLLNSKGDFHAQRAAMSDVGGGFEFCGIDGDNYGTTSG
jgi:hypothetical protein